MLIDEKRLEDWIKGRTPSRTRRFIWGLWFSVGRLIDIQLSFWSLLFISSRVLATCAVCLTPFWIKYVDNTANTWPSAMYIAILIVVGFNVYIYLYDRSSKYLKVKRVKRKHSEKLV